MDKRRVRGIYTDGSKMENKVRSGLVVFNNSEEIASRGYRINDCTTVFMAELYAIDKAIEYIIREGCTSRYDENYATISDSLSALQVITSINKNRSYILHNRIKYLSIDLYWTKAHVGDEANEKTDIIAKSATTKTNIDTKFHKTKHQLRVDLDIKYKEIWNDRWNQSTKGRNTWNFIKITDYDRIYSRLLFEPSFDGTQNFSQVSIRKVQ